MERLSSLRELILLDNELSELPPLIGCQKLRHLDVSLNQIRSFEADILKMKLHQLHCEKNPLDDPVESHLLQFRAPSTLKELVLRHFANGDKARWSLLPENFLKCVETYGECDVCRRYVTFESSPMVTDSSTCSSLEFPTRNIPFQ